MILNIKIKKSIMLFTLSGCMLVAPLNASTVDELSDQEVELSKEQENLQAQISDVTDDIVKYQEQIDTLNSQIKDNKAEIKQLNSDKKKTEKKIEQSKSALGDSLIVMQKVNNSNAMASYMFGDDENDNYFLKAENASIVADSINGDVSTFLKEIDELSDEIDEIEKLQTENKNNKIELQEEIDKQTAIEDDLNEQLAAVDSDLLDVQTTKSQAEAEAEAEAQAEELSSTEATSSSGGSTSSSSSSTVYTGNVSAQKQAIMSAAGISSSDYTYVDYIVTKESGWNSTATNAVSGAYGLCQSLPGSKMASAGSDWQTNAVTQMKWCDSYATSRYGSWASAYSFWIANNWW